MNGGPVARPGLMLGEDEAAVSKKLFKHLPGPPRPVFGPKILPQIKIYKTYGKITRSK